MNYLVLDVETNKLGKDARICSISWSVYNKKGYKLKMKTYLVKPGNDFIMTEGAQKVHNISLDMMKINGKKITYILKKLRKVLKKDKIKGIVGHNLIFDETVINYECKLNNEEMLFNNVKKSCTMLIGYELLNLDKWPKLSELYELLFKEKINNKKLHTSNYDVECCAKIFFLLKNSYK